MRSPFNRAGYEQREVAHKQRIIDKVFLGFDASVINVNDIGQAVKSIKRNPDRQNHLQQNRTRIQTKGMQQISKRSSEKVIVFKNSQKANIDRNAEPEPKFSVGGALTVFNFHGTTVIQQRGENQQKQKSPIPTRVEVIAGQD